MANNTLNTRIVLCNDTTVNWGSSEKVLLKGELAIELTSEAPKFKIGDGVHKYSELAYVTMTPAEISSAISTAVNNASHSHSNKSILDAITAAFTTQLKTNYDAAYTHSQSAHAPSNARANVIESVKVNGTAQTVTSKAVDIKVPTKVSELTNDAKYISSYVDTTYSLGANTGATNGNAKVTLSGSDKSEKSVVIKGTGAASVTTDADGNVVVNSTNTVYTHPASGVTAGTYKSVTVNSQGHVTAGTNPTTLAGYGITDAAAKSHTHGSADITSLDASKLTGTIDIARLPQGALERCVVVADDTARFKLTTASVQSGDTVKVEKTGLMYFVVDESKLSSEAGYEVYTAGSATSVPWSGVTGKPDTYTPSAHNQAISTITGLQDALNGKATSAQGTKADTAVQSVKIGNTEYKSGTTVTLPAYPTTLPASDVSAWAKASTKPSYSANEIGFTTTADTSIKNVQTGLQYGIEKIADLYTNKSNVGHTHTKSEVGLGNVDNTADANKSVKYATSAGSATSATTASKLGTDAGSTVQPVYFANGVPVACNVSTNYLTQGTDTLILNGGGAA